MNCLSVSTRLLAIWLLCVGVATLAPFNFRSVAEMAQVFAFGSYERDPVDFVLNLLLFAPLGVMLHAARHRSSKLVSIVILAGTAAALISMTVEFLQAFLPIRNSSLIDVVANTGGALIGVAADRAWGAHVRRGVERLRAHTSRRVLGGLTAGFLLAALLVSGALQARTRLDNWSTDYPLIIGNERTGDRPWRGRVVALSMSDTATPLASLRRFAAGEPLALRGTPVAAFDFTGSPPYSDAAGNVPDLHWTGPPSSGHTGANLTGSSWLRTSGPAATLADRLRKTSAFTLRIKCATDDTDQDGPARIVSNSASPFLRNFTLGQQGGDLVFRLRTPETGANGYPLEVLVPGVFSDFNPSEILVSYDGATLLVATDRSGDVSRTDLGPGSGVALAIQSLNVRADELELYQLAYVALLALVPGVLMGLLGHTTRDRQVFGGGWVLAFAVLLEATLVQASGRAFDWANVALTAGVAAVVCTVFSTALSQADVTWAGSFRPDVWRRAT